MTHVGRRCLSPANNYFLSPPKVSKKPLSRFGKAFGASGGRRGGGHLIEWSPCKGYVSLPATHLVDSAAARLNGQTATAAEKLRALKWVAGFLSNREAIRAVRPHRLAILIRRAIRLPGTKELATLARQILSNLAFTVTCGSPGGGGIADPAEHSLAHQ